MHTGKEGREREREKREQSGREKREERERESHGKQTVNTMVLITNNTHEKTKKHTTHKNSRYI